MLAMESSTNSRRTCHVRIALPSPVGGHLRLVLGLVGLLATPCVALGATTLHLAWNDCYGSPTAATVKTFLCDADSTTIRLVGSCVPDSADTNVVGFSAVLDFATTGGVPLSDWWMLQTGGCREGSVTVSYRNIMSTGCRTIPWSPMSLLGSTYSTSTNRAVPGGAQLSLIVADTRISANLVPGEEYALFEIDLDTHHTTGTDGAACGGCAQAMCIAFYMLDLYIPSLYDQQLHIGSADATVAWRCANSADVYAGSNPMGWLEWGLTSCTLGQCPTPVVRPTWGRLRSLYR